MRDKEYTCPSCGDRLKRIFSKRRQKYFWVCDGVRTDCVHWYNDSDGVPQLRPVTKTEPDPGVVCPECQSPMCLVTGATAGDFYSCSRYPDCRGTIDSQADGNLAPLCPAHQSHGYMRRRDGMNGVFWSCRRYPDCTATREVAERHVRKVNNASAVARTKPTESDSTTG